MKRKRCPTCHQLEKRSHAANARYWLLLHQISEQVKPSGKTYGAETWHTWAKSRFLGCDEVRMPNGKTLLIPKSTTDLDGDAFGDYMTAVEAWAAERDVFLADMETA